MVKLDLTGTFDYDNQTTVRTMNRNKICACIALIICLITIVSIYFETLSVAWDDYIVNAGFRNHSNLESTIVPLKEKKILLWTSMFSDEYFYFGKSGHFDNCPRYNNCLLTRSREPAVTDFDAVLFHGNELDRDNLPEKRDSGQIYVFVNLESPKSRPITDSFFDEGYFNMTMTYRLDSDIPWPYKILRNIETGEMVAPRQDVSWIEPQFNSIHDPHEKTLLSQIEKRKKMAAWLVSNCNTSGKRELYVAELRNYINVDVIGRCSEPTGVSCPRTRDCFPELIEVDYLFYLSFENTLCEDYVTEKFFNALRHNVVPVVYGGANYSLFAPPHSYIDALDFHSPKALADFLIELSKNREEYMKYFWWKKFYTIDSAGSWTLCNFCEMLNKPITPKIYSPLSSWFMQDICPIHEALNYGNFATKDSKPHKRTIT